MNSDCRLIFEKYVKDVISESLDSGTMTSEQLKDYLLNIKRPIPVSVVVEAPVKALKKSRISGAPNPYQSIIKKSTISGMGGGDYEMGIWNKELAAHQDDPNYMPQFRTEPLWKGKGERVSHLVARHVETGEYYLVIGDVRSGTGEYKADGNPVDATAVEEYIPLPPPPSAKQAAVGIATEDQKKVRYPKINNIKSIHINNVDIQIT
ncbi:MAG: hypothetical protein PHS54_00320 [Clostridia bacterium]|nr:hypothetical protein [Clostridia bacterium]